MTDASLPLQSRRIAVPESRQLDLFADMLEKRGADVLRCPLVAIHDSPDNEAVDAWLDRCIAGEFDDLILMTGEGLRRLVGFAERSNRKQEFIEALAPLRKITRGPKPERALREIGLRGDLKAAEPTSEGVIETLGEHDLSLRAVALQLYPDPSPLVEDYLSQQAAAMFPVYPYVYTDEAEDQRVAKLVDEIIQCRIDAIAFTSSPQIRRLFSVAQSAGNEDELRVALQAVTVAAVGPIVSGALQKRGIEADVQPAENYFMKPLVNEISRRLAPQGA